MQEFTLDSSVEYQKLKEIRKIISSVTDGGQAYTNPVFTAVSLIVNKPDRDVEIIRNLSTADNGASAQESLNKELVLVNKKKEMLSLIARPELISSFLGEFNVRLSKNVYSIYAVSNFAFADYIFRYECETEDLKKFRTGPNEDPQAVLIRNIRRKAEDAYRNNKFDEAIVFFNEAIGKYQNDFTIYYQLGLIYFFEKADFKRAMENFRLASKYAQNKYNPIFIHGMVFTGLLLKLYALHVKNLDMLNEAYQAIYQAYAADTGYNFSKYALAQCTAAMAVRSDLVAQANSLIKNLVMADKLFAIQILYDVAFNSYIDELDKLFKTIYNEFINNVTRLFEKIDLALDLVSNNQQYLTIPARVGSIKTEYKKLVEQINNKKTFFDIDQSYGASSRIAGELEEMAKEIERNKKYSETRAIVEAAIKNYKEEFQELTKHYSDTEVRFQELKEQYLKLNSYYPNPEFDELAVNIFNNADLIIDAERKFWREGGLFLLIKILSGVLTFVFLFLIIVVLSTIFSKGIGSFFGVVGVLIALVFMPLYATVLAEIYYNVVEIKRRNLLTDLKKYKGEIDINKLKISEIDKKISVKYITLISEQTKLTQFVCEKMFEACLEGNFEQIKSMI
ncbi:MAG TPA: hypothetical protein PK467_02645 [Candidatus Wallbacteria bacterium]|nr:hypothetical protein [Candidatus Wallbacteria bacterium]